MRKYILLTLIPLIVFFTQTLFSQQSDFTFQDIANIEDLSSPFIKCSYQDSKGLLWIGSKGGLDRWDGHRIVNFTYMPFDSLRVSFKEIQRITGDDQNKLWIVNGMRELIMYDLEKESFKQISLVHDGAK